MDRLESLLGRNGFLPHGYCFRWTPELLWPMVAADLLIALAYLSIPLTILQFVRRRPVARSDRGVPLMFGAFIFACALTHLMGVWTLWQPDYAAQTAIKLATAAVSVVTAVMLWKLLPQALRLPSAAQLQGAVAALEIEAAQRRTVEQHLHEVEQAMAVALASVGAGFIATDRLGQVTRMNGVAEQVTGWSVADGLGRSIWEVFGREGRDPQLLARNPIEVLNASGLAGQMQRVVCRSRDGRLLPVELTAELLRGDAHEVRGMAVMFRDMARLSAAETESRRMAAIVESSSDAVIAKGLDNRITAWNEAAARLFGWTASEVLGMPGTALVPPQAEAQASAALAEAAAGVAVASARTTRLARDGRLLDVSVAVSPVRDALGRVDGVAEVIRDLTQQRLVEAAQHSAEEARRHAQRLEDENRRVQETSRAKARFLANMSHELRTPLNAVIGFAELLAGDLLPAASPKRQEFVGHIARSGRHLLQIINDVLDLSKVDAGKLDFNPQVLDLAAVFDEVVRSFSHQAAEKHLAMTTGVAPELREIRLDPLRLRQVLFNYLSNAVKFTPAGGTIELLAFAEGPQRLRIEVRDCGIGIAREQLAELFVEFQQLDDGYAKRHQGTGLGLALTRKLVEAQGGQVGVVSELGRGSVFYAVLPRWAPLAGAAAESVAAPGEALVAEADQGLRNDLAHSLEALGVSARTGSSLAEVVDLLRLRHYRFISLGLRLQDAHGFEALSHLPGGRPTPVRGLSAAADDGRRVVFDVLDLVPKPLLPGRLEQALAPLMPALSGGAVVWVVDDDTAARELMLALLAGLNAMARGFGDGLQVLQALDAAGLDPASGPAPCALVLDLMMPGMDGLELLRLLRADTRWCELPVLVWTAMSLSEAERDWLARRADAVIEKASEPLGDTVARMARAVASGNVTGGRQHSGV